MVRTRMERWRVAERGQELIDRRGACMRGITTTDRPCRARAEQATSRASRRPRLSTNLHPTSQPSTTKRLTA
eukprot:15371411-Alexandrium_andersonii.AAC.1